MQVGMKLEGLPELQKKLGKTKFRTALKKGMTNAVVFLEGAIKKNTPVKSGQLRGSFTHKVSLDGTEGVVGTNKEYAQAVEEGTGVYIGKGRIYPTSAKALAWDDTVRHSIAGMKGRFFVKKAWDDNKPKLVKYIKLEFDKALGGKL